MKKTILITVFGLMANFAWAGPNSSGGTQGTVNVVSKAKIQAVLDAITQGDDSVQGIWLTEGARVYAVRIRNGACVREELYSVKGVQNEGLPEGSIRYVANYIDLNGNPDCD